MALVPKNDVTQIFAIQAPEVDLPPTFANYPRGWDTARSNNGKPTIKQFNYLQQRTDQNFLWIHQNGAALPYDATMEYAEGAVVVKDGELQKKQGASWVSATNKGYNLDYFVSGKPYPLHAEIMLENGDIVKSTVPNNTIDPNVDMTGWVNHEKDQQDRNLDSRSIFDFLAGSNLAAWKANKNTFDWSPIFQMAELYARNYGGSEIRLPMRGSPYLVNGITGADGVLNGLLFKFAGATNWRGSTPPVRFVGDNQNIKIVAGSNNMHIVRMSSSFCSLENVFLDQGGKTGVNALSLIPENTLSPHANSQQSYNYISNVSMWGTKEGLTLQCGGDGGAYYNEFNKVTYHGGNLDGTRGFYLKAGIPKTGGTYVSPPNRNKFFSCDASNCNTAYEIESGDTNTFFGCTAETINKGTSPNTIPTALKIKERDGSISNWYNQGNSFHGFTVETCTRDLEVMNPYTHFFGCRAEASKSVVDANFGRNGTFIGVIGSPSFPNIFAGIVQRGDALPSGMDANYGLSVADHFADQGYRQASKAVTLAMCTNVSSISGSRGRFTRLNKAIDWHFRFQFTATVTTAQIEIDIPAEIIPHIDLYCTYDTNAQMRFSIQRINQSNVTFVHYAHFNADGTKLVIPAPTGGWSTFTDNKYDGVFVQLRYLMA